MEHTGAKRWKAANTLPAPILDTKSPAAYSLTPCWLIPEAAQTNNTWFEENTEWAAQDQESSLVKAPRSYSVLSSDPLPFGGELRQEMVRRHNYTVNGQPRCQQVSSISEKAPDHSSHRWCTASRTGNSTTARTSRGYYPERGFSFAEYRSGEIFKLCSLAPAKRGNGNHGNAGEQSAVLF